MSEVGFSNQSNNLDIKELSKQVSTTPSPLEKKIGEDFVEGIKETFNEVKDTFSDSLKTTEGKAVATGLVVSAINPVIGLGFIFGGVGLAAMKFLEGHN